MLHKRSKFYWAIQSLHFRLDTIFHSLVMGLIKFCITTDKIMWGSNIQLTKSIQHFRLVTQLFYRIVWILIRKTRWWCFHFSMSKCFSLTQFKLNFQGNLYESFEPGIFWLTKPSVGIWKKMCGTVAGTNESEFSRTGVSFY